MFIWVIISFNPFCLYNLTVYQQMPCTEGSSTKEKNKKAKSSTQQI